MKRSSLRVYLPLAGATLLLAGAVLAAPTPPPPPGVVTTTTTSTVTPPPPLGATPTAGYTPPPPPPPGPAPTLVPYVAAGSFASNGLFASLGSRHNIRSAQRLNPGSYNIGLANTRGVPVTCTVSSAFGGPFGGLCKGDMTGSAYDTFGVSCFAPGKVGNSYTGPMEPTDLAFNITCIGAPR